ncbi:hypothetical protein EDB81DRAFT_767781 [Dactylonectria macrodidyma]|uniref:Uncharacterized protein n=1 Tax=Dactylonectria macrodidyma TaxID=307937 RepID=A0A9P9D972_9HYPO|nr:hypothetical protein EDB81DRAFT_767781 [Dactylonectria macrodidyma]
MSSPTLEAVTNISNVISEAALMHRDREAFSTDRLQRLEKWGKRRKIGQRVRPTGDFITCVSFPDIQAQHQASLAAAEVKEHRSQVRFSRSLIIQEITSLRKQWKEAKEARGPENPIRLTSNLWPAETHNADRYHALEAQRKEHSDILKEETQVPFSRAQEEARRAPRPILAMDPNAYPSSDDMVQFTGITTLEDDDNDDIELIGFDGQEEEDFPDPETSSEMPSSPPLPPADLPLGNHDDLTTTLPPPATNRRQSRYRTIMTIFKESWGQQGT